MLSSGVTPTPPLRNTSGLLLCRKTGWTHQHSAAFFDAQLAKPGPPTGLGVKLVARLRLGGDEQVGQEDVAVLPGGYDVRAGEQQQSGGAVFVAFLVDETNRSDLTRV